MPIYEYKCVQCGARVEKRQSVSDAPLTACEKCHGKRVVEVADIDRLTPEQLDAWHAHCEAEEWRAVEHAAEMRLEY